MLDHIEIDSRHIEYLAPIPYPCVLCRQNRVAPFALLGQAMRRDLVRQLCLSERRSLAALLAAGLIVRRLAQRVRLLGQPVGRRRLARIVVVRAQLGFDRIQARKQGTNEAIFVGIGQLRHIETGLLR